MAKREGANEPEIRGISLIPRFIPSAQTDEVSFSIRPLSLTSSTNDLSGGGGGVCVGRGGGGVNRIKPGLCTWITGLQGLGLEA